MKEIKNVFQDEYYNLYGSLTSGGNKTQVPDFRTMKAKKKKEKRKKKKRKN